MPKILNAGFKHCIDLKHEGELQSSSPQTDWRNLWVIIVGMIWHLGDQYCHYKTFKSSTSMLQLNVPECKFLLPGNQSSTTATGSFHTIAFVEMSFQCDLFFSLFSPQGFSFFTCSLFLQPPSQDADVSLNIIWNRIWCTELIFFLLCIIPTELNGNGGSGRSV